MERRTYYAQRIHHAEVRTSIDNQPIRDGEVVTAGQTICPTQATAFEDLSDKSSKVEPPRADVLNCDLLGKLNT